MDKEKKKLLRRKAGFFFLKIFTFFGGIIPPAVSSRLSAVLGNIAYAVLARHRRIALASLSMAFEGYRPAKIRKIARDSFVSMAQGGFELLYYLKNREKIHQAVKIEGRGNLDKALAKGRGAIIVTAHYGNFPLMSLGLAVEGYPVNIVARPMRDKYAEGHFHKLRTDAGVKNISVYPRRACVSGIISALAANEIVVIQMDQNFGTGGVWVDFFGKLAATPTGPIILSLRTKAPLIPGYIRKTGNCRHLVKIMPPQELEAGRDKNDTILINASKFTKIIESWIKESPYQWSWVHRRWKSRPPKSKKNN